MDVALNACLAADSDETRMRGRKPPPHPRRWAALSTEEARSAAWDSNINLFRLDHTISEHLGHD